MSRVHDMGGQTGFGPVPTGADGGVGASYYERWLRAIEMLVAEKGVA